ncbi:ABC transporter permease [Gordoniibacillus kamchatkensis]|uniref:ABC transporter permease n=1 Tax=Gordoniibacillus kamchatkensis TaxID=1590651 RepID=A0ABR5AFS2_9BACL|nr:ABC-2 family transporter protein [Paenibacillus sp. VKM B-2647]KIL39668.1 ABC transporter permease [Paenibacillus sp. VKM B-2647]
MFYAELVVTYLKNYMKTRLTYRSDFWIEVATDLLFNVLNLFVILVLFRHTPLIGNWNEQQMLFIYGYFMVPYGIFGTFFNLWGFTERYIVKGEMDRVLTRPAHNLMQLMLENLDPASLFSSLAGFVIMALSWPQLGVTLSWYDPFVFVLLAAGSVLVYAGVYVSLTAIGFFSDAPTGILPLVWNFQNYGRYPVTIYNRTLKLLLSVVLPFGFVGFYPAAYFLDRAHWLWVALLTPVVGVAFFALSMQIWKMGVLRYRGAGS